MAREPAAALDLDLAIADRGGDLAGGPDQQPSAHGQLALEAPADLGVLDRCGAREEAAFGNGYVPAILDVCLDGPLDDQPVARADLAGEYDLAADHEGPGRGLRLRERRLAVRLLGGGGGCGFPRTIGHDGWGRGRAGRLCGRFGQRCGLPHSGEDVGHNNPPAHYASMTDIEDATHRRARWGGVILRLMQFFLSLPQWLHRSNQPASSTCADQPNWSTGTTRVGR